MLRYANEFNGVRVAAGIGYERIQGPRDAARRSIPTAPLFVGPQPDIEAWGGALSVMHVPTGSVRPGPLHGG